MTGTIQQFDFNVDLLKSILWQYENAPNLKSLIEQKQDWYNTNYRDFWQLWYTNVFNLETADDFGLQVWSIILGQPLFVNLPASGNPTWGFGHPYHANFDRGNFASGGNELVRLDSTTARILLQLRYHQLTGSGTIPDTNRMLARIFKDYGACWLNDAHDMTQFYTFTFVPPAQLRFIFDNFDVLPRPAGVQSSYRVIVEPPFGFDQYNANFDNGNFNTE